MTDQPTDGAKSGRPRARKAIRPVPDDHQISAELERELFQKFWLWLRIVATILIAVVSAISVITAAYLLEIARNTSLKAAQDELTKLSGRIESIQNKSDDVVARSSINQERASNAARAAADIAERAKGTLAEIEKKADLQRQSLLTSTQLEEITNNVARNPTFAELVLNVVTKDSIVIISKTFKSKSTQAYGSNDKMYVNCPNDAPNVIAGGFDFDRIGNEILAINSKPNFDPPGGKANGWMVEFAKNTEGPSSSFNPQVWAVCTKLSTQYRDAP